jgi:single-strand DNA-binding protein
MAMTTVTIVGNLTRDPELKFTGSGLAMCTFGLAVNNRRKDESGNWVDGDPSFFDVVCWRNLAENVTESIPKGTTVIVTGKLRQRSWEADDGSKRSKVEVNAEHVGPALNWATCEVMRNERKTAVEDVRPGEEPF